MTGGKATADEVVTSWYEQIKNYNFKKPGFSGNTGHFTQLVWKDSKELGAAKHVSGTSTYIVCFYDPSVPIVNSNSDILAAIISLKCMLQSFVDDDCYDLTLPQLFGYTTQQTP
uniref:SCP domain-containing protein n=1 Tax=Glossina pallidipes TaxID=7398 RepID=A0A1B0ABE4_GLOPL